MISDYVNPLFQWLNNHPELAGFATFLISAGESVAILGTIVPGSVMMTAIGALVGAGIIPLWPTLIWAILGAIAGDGISYWIGHYFKDRLHQVWPFRGHPQILQQGELFFHRYGGMSVFFGRFVGPVRALVPLVAGMLGMRPLRFTIANVASAIGWAPAYMFPGIILGAASLELPSEIGARFILFLIFIVLLIILCFWVIKRIFELIAKQVNGILSSIWKFFSKSRPLRFLTSLLKHYDSNRPHGQLGLGLLLIMVVLLFLALACKVHFKTPHVFIMNNLLFHLFRGIRTGPLDTIMLCLTLLGDKHVLLPLVLTLFAWFAYKKCWHTAWHVLALGALTLGSIECFKYLIQSPRPWGFFGNQPQDYSFPSGHTTFALVSYLGLALFFVYNVPLKKTRLVYSIAGLLIGVVALSRLYFGVHWFTDILGGLLLGTALLMIIVISYNRKAEKHIASKGVFFTALLTLALSYSTALYSSFNTLKSAYAMLDWPVYTTTLESWWDHKNDEIPLFRINRYGFKSTIFNVQWFGNIDTIKTVLLQNDWEVPATQDWLTVFYRVSSVHSTQHLPLISPLFLDKPPRLILTKNVIAENKKKKLMIIRLWDSNIHFKNFREPLWLGTVEYAPSTYSWLFKNYDEGVPVTTNILFIKPPSQYDIKLIKVIVQLNHQNNVEKNVLLLKQKNFFYSWAE